MLSFEFNTNLDPYLASVGGDAPRSLAELIAFNEEHRDDELRFFGQELFEQAVARGLLTDPAYVEALATCGRLAREEGLDAVFAEHRRDAIVAPSGAPAWVIDHVNGDHYVGGNISSAAISGYPSITIPMGFVSGLPVGISFIGRARSDAEQLGYAFAFERATEHPG